MIDFMECKWRTGSKNGRVIYAQWTDEPMDEDLMIGSFDTPEAAAHVVEMHNASLSGN